MKNKYQYYQGVLVGSDRGFTLIEIMIVLAIVAMLAGMVGLNVMRRFKESQVKTSRLQMGSLQDALQDYYIDNNMYPTTEQGLDALVHKPTVGTIPQVSYRDGGYLKGSKVPNDAYGHPYRYKCDDGQNFTLSSDGPDGKEGTDDDIKMDQN